MTDIDIYSNTFTKEPEFKCPSCGAELFTEWVDNGFGPYSVQASPYGCECGWHETGCSECIKEKCFSWDTCQGRALIVKPAIQDSVIINMKDPNLKQDEATGTEVAPETTGQPSEVATESAEEGSTEG